MIDFGKTEKALEETLRLLAEQNAMLVIVVLLLLYIAVNQRPRRR